MVAGNQAAIKQHGIVRYWKLRSVNPFGHESRELAINAWAQVRPHDCPVRRCRHMANTVMRHLFSVWFHPIQMDKWPHPTQFSSSYFSHSTDYELPSTSNVPTID